MVESHVLAPSHTPAQDFQLEVLPGYRCRQKWGGRGGGEGRGNDGRGSVKGSRVSTTVFQYSLTGMDVVQGGKETTRHRVSAPEVRPRWAGIEEGKSLE